MITIIEVKGDQVRLGIRAPREVTVHRDEVAADIRQANQEAAKAVAPGATALPRPRIPSE